MSRSFTTYAILDPRSRLIVYVGQTSDYTKRCRQHQATHRTRSLKPGTVKHWLKRLHEEGHAPLFLILEVVETEEESLISESKWVEKLAAVGQPLFNKWDEHRELIELAEADRALEPLVFGQGKPRLIGTVEWNASKTGYRVHVGEGVSLAGPLTIDLLPTRGGNDGPLPSTVRTPVRNTEGADI